MTVSQTQLQPPQDWQSFERASAILWSLILDDSGLTRFGRSGQAQHGLDMTGYRRSDPAFLVGIQCKCINQGKVLDQKIVRTEFEKVLKSDFPIREYYITHTGQNDSKLDQLAIELTEEQRKIGRSIVVRIWGWESLQDRIFQYEKALEAFDPNWSPSARRSKEESAETNQKLDRLIEQISRIEPATNPGYLQAIDTADTSTNLLDSAQDREIDRYRNMVRDGHPTQALKCLELLWQEIDDKISGRIRFRIRANIGHCHMQLGDNENAARELISAYEYFPDDQKSITNKILGLLLNGSAQEALRHAKEGLKRFPDSEVLGAYLIQAVIHQTGDDDPLSLLPVELRDTEQVKVSYIDYLRAKKRVPEWWDVSRSASIAFPDNNVLKVFAADAVVDRLTRSVEGGQWLDASQRDELAVAALVLEGEYKKAVAHDCPARPDHVAHITNYAISLFTLGDLPRAKEVVRYGLDLLPTERHLLILAGRIGLETDDAVFQDFAFSGLVNDDGEALLLKSRIAARRRDWQFLRCLSDIEIEKTPECDRNSLRVLVKTAVARTEQPEKAAKIASELVENTAADPRSSILAAGLAHDLTLTDLEKRAFENAISGIAPDSHFSSRSMVANYAMQRSAYGIVIRLLDGYVGMSQDSVELQVLAAAYAYAVPSRESGNTFFSNLQTSLRSKDYYLRLEGIFRYNEGDLCAAETAFRELHKRDPKNSLSILAVVQTLSRDPGSQFAVREFLSSLDIAGLKGKPADKSRVAYALQLSGRTDDAVLLAYDALSEGRNDPDTNLIYASLIFGIESSRMLDNPEAIGINCWVELTGPSSEALSFLIEEGPDRPAESTYSPTHRYAQECLGKAVGDSVSLPHPSGYQTWLINGIESRFLRAFRDVTENFNARFPDQSGFWKMTMKDGDISPILDVIRKHGEHRDVTLRAYENNVVPLHFLASTSGEGDVISLMETIRATGGEIRTCFGSNSERTSTLKYIHENSAKGVVLDTLTFWTAAGLDSLDILKAVFVRVMIARPTVDEINAMRGEYCPGVKRQMASSHFYNGQFYFHEITDEDWKTKEEIFALREAALRDIEVAKVHYPDNANLNVEEIMQEFGLNLLAPALVAAEHGKILVSDDLAYRAIARELFGVTGTWLQTIFMYALQTGVIDISRYTALIAELARLKHGFVAVEASTLVASVPTDGSVRDGQFDALTDYLGTRSADMNSHLVVAVEFLRRIWDAPVTNTQTLAATGLLLEKLTRVGPFLIYAYPAPLM